MKILADFDKAVVVHNAELNWQASPMPGVARKPLDRVGEEVARATTIVRYDAGSHFSSHVHTGGEEFVVLEGVFQDEHGDYPEGTYVRNPPTSKHTPRSEKGCTILVKLWQFEPEDRAHVRIPLYKVGSLPDANHKGVYMTPLFKDNVEEVILLKLEPDAVWHLKAIGGAELFVLAGTVLASALLANTPLASTATEEMAIEQQTQQDTLVKHDWLRAPVASNIQLKAGESGASIWLKTGHLSHISAQINRIKQILS